MVGRGCWGEDGYQKIKKSRLGSRLVGRVAGVEDGYKEDSIVSPASPFTGKGRVWSTDYTQLGIADSTIVVVM